MRNGREHGKSGRSVGLDETVSLDEMRARGEEPSVGPDVYRDEEAERCINPQSRAIKVLAEMADRNPRACQILLLSAVQGLSLHAIARRLRIDRRAVARHLQRLCRQYPQLSQLQ